MIFCLQEFQYIIKDYWDILHIVQVYFQFYHVSGEINLMSENDNNNSKNKNKMTKREYYILESYKFLWIPKKRWINWKIS